MEAADVSTPAGGGSPRRAGYRRSAGSPRGEARRRELLDRVTADLAVNGLVDFSLRRAARAAGTTHKVLLYHFDGADDLLRQAILQLRERRIAIELSAGTVEYEDTGGDGPVVVFLHGLMMDASLWDGVVAELSAGYRCVAPTLPLGAHRHPVRAGADLSLPAIARLAGEFLDRLDLHDVTLVGNDTGGALVQLLIRDGVPRAGRVVLVSCDAFDNFPPGLTGKTLVLSGKLPPRMFGLFMQQMRLRAIRRLPIAFGWLTRYGDAVTAQWMQPVMKQPGIRRDAVRMLRAAASGTHLLAEAARSLPDFSRPALVVWAREDRVMPPEHGRRLTGLLPHAELAEVDDSYTLVPLDQPARLARLVREFARASAPR